MDQNLYLHLSFIHTSSDEEWQNICFWYKQHQGMCSHDAIFEYLRIAQGLEMYGVYYFEIQSKSLLRSKQKCNLWLGICPFGINIYEDEDQLMPIRRFLWKELENIKFKKRQFIIILDKNKTKKKEKFTVCKTRINKIILDLCIGYHVLQHRNNPKTCS